MDYLNKNEKEAPCDIEYREMCEEVEQLQAELKKIQNRFNQVSKRLIEENDHLKNLLWKAAVEIRDLAKREPCDHDTGICHCPDEWLLIEIDKVALDKTSDTEKTENEIKP